ncbi:hypothetical protein CALVIDRAFT_30056 [Calocera viscosa TUFC12733]|uniref:Uncharacterized protein n=1 Tax=Calocera viscosa (strain TUFC12733) TaxID=1330018 RepID=A0A167PC34_CALVF|nr:hypothetical protein CALVIDRAFT_30056 [Calocera viscosa TUFC12733]
MTVLGICHLPFQPGKGRAARPPPLLPRSGLAMAARHQPGCRSLSHTEGGTEVYPPLAYRQRSVCPCGLLPSV